MQMRRSGIQSVHGRAGARADVIDLTIGQPDRPTPSHIVEAGARALTDGATRYTPIAGFASLREALVAKLAGVNGIITSPDQVIVTVGAMSGLMAAMLTLLEPGDAVLLPDPGWTGFYLMAENLGLEILPYSSWSGERLQPDLDQIETFARRANARVIVVNSPANPTGLVVDEQTAHEIVEVARRHDLVVLSDEAYDQITFEEPATSFGAVDGEVVVSVFSFSKTFSMTGWRVGYATGPREAIELMTKVQENLVGCPPAVSQRAAEAALAGPQDCVERARALYRSRRDVVLQHLGSSSLRAVPPHGGLYVFLDARAIPVADVAGRLLSEAGVALVSGETFGEGGRGFLRLCLTVDKPELVEAVARIRGYFSTLAA